MKYELLALMAVVGGCSTSSLDHDDAAPASAEPDAFDGQRSTTDLEPSQARVTRDEDGIPHIEAPNLATAMYALGYVHAEDRLFQMFRRRATVRGQLSRHFAKPPVGIENIQFNEKLLERDVRARTLGFGAELDQTIEAMSPEYVALLEAYARGVNDQVATRSSLGTAFEILEIETVDPWTAADALSGWEFLSELVANSHSALGTELWFLSECESEGGCPDSCTVINDDAAVVPEPADGVWPPSGSTVPGPPIACTTSEPQLGELRPPVDVKASQGFVVSGEHMAGHNPMIFGEPQVVLQAPATWYEHHIIVPSEGIDTRGAGFAGSPGMTMFYSRHGSQTVTAGGGDRADLFELKSAAPGTYHLDGDDVPFETRTETIEVRHGEPVELPVRTTVFGPVVTGILADPANSNILSSGREFAARRITSRAEGDHSVIAGIDIMRATSFSEYQDALRHWVSPAMNALYAGVDEDTGEQHIAYHALVGIANRVCNSVQGTDVRGRHPYDGTTSANDWQGLLALEWNPHVVDPEDGYLFSGNHLPAGSWYDDHVYAGLGGRGDSYRSFELRRRLSRATETPALIPAHRAHLLHFDTVSESLLLLSDLVEEYRKRELIEKDDPAITPSSKNTDYGRRVARAATALQMWRENGDGLLDQNVVGSDFAHLFLGKVGLHARDRNLPGFNCVWGGSESGATHFLADFASGSEEVFTADAVAVVSNALDAAWREYVLQSPTHASDPEAWEAEITASVLQYHLDWGCLQPGNGDRCSLDPAFDQSIQIDRAYVHTIGSPAASAWPFTVDFADVDTARARIGPGVSEEPGSIDYDLRSSLIEQQGRGDNESIPHAPLSMDLITPRSVVVLQDPGA